jgi:Nuclease-related domain
VILKESESVYQDIERLEALLGHPNADARARVKIEEQIRILKAGERGESSAFYHIKTYFGPSKNWVVLNDLRLEHDGHVAQIDHLLIGRLLDIWVCESKHVSNGVKINEFGEFMTFDHNRKPRGMASPIEQNERHIHVLKMVFDAGALQMPRRLGLTLKPRFHSAVLIAKGTISRPKVPIPGLETVIQTEQLRQHINKRMDAGSALDLAKLVSFETIEQIGRQLADLHRPIAFDWEKRLGLHDATPRRAPKPAPLAAPRAEPEVAAAKAKAVEVASTAVGGCASCGCAISRGVRTFCEKNPERFGGTVYCMTCQPNVGTANRA